MQQAEGTRQTQPAVPQSCEEGRALSYRRDLLEDGPEGLMSEGYVLECRKGVPFLAAWSSYREREGGKSLEFELSAEEWRETWRRIEAVPLANCEGTGGDRRQVRITGAGQPRAAECNAAEEPPEFREVWTALEDLLAPRVEAERRGLEVLLQACPEQDCWKDQLR